MKSPPVPPYDPSENVFALVAAAVTRVDDLRKAQELLAEERQDSLRREMELRANHHKAFAILRAEYTEKSLQSESKRLDALRDLDRLEARTASERHQTAVDTLAKATSSLAETLRASVENTARNLAAQNESSKKELDSRISALERLQAAGTGKGAGLQAFWGYLLGAAGFLAAIVALASRFMR